MLRRNSRSIEESLARVTAGIGARDRDRLSQELRIVIRDASTNTFREHSSINAVVQVSPCSFHQDALMSHGG